MIHKKSKSHHIIIKLLLFLVSFTVNAQQQLIPFTQNYSKLDYEGDALTWAITQTESKLMYFANNRFLLEFDGNRWQKFTLPKKTIIRSVFAKGNLVYTGSYNEFGYWKRDGHELKYHSLVKNVRFEDNDEIWNIFEYEGKIVFQSFLAFYILENNQIKKYRTPSQITYAFQVNKDLYVPTIKDGVYIFKKNQFIKDSRFDALKNMVIHAILPYQHQILFFTLKHGVFVWNGKSLESWKNPINDDLKKEMIHSAKIISTNMIAVGTSTNGLYLIDFLSGKYNTFNKHNGSLQNNSVLNIYKDNEANIWLGLDNGISLVQYDQNVFAYQDYTGQLGSVYSIVKNNRGFLLGSNHGLFELTEKELNFVPNSQGPVWNITEAEGQYVVGHNTGTFIYDHQNFTKINDYPGGYKFSKIAKDFYIQTNYVGAFTYKWINNQWEIHPVAKDFIKPINDFVVNENFIWATDTNKGVYKINYENGKVEHIKTAHGGELFNTKIVKINNHIYFLSDKQWYEYDSWSKSLKISNRLMNLLPEIDDVIVLSENMFLVQSDGLLAIAKVVNEKVVWHNVPMKYYYGKLVNGYFSILLENGYLYLNLDNGFLKYKIDLKDSNIPKVYVEAQSQNEFLENKSKLSYYNNMIDFFVSTRTYGNNEQDLYYRLIPGDQKFKPLQNGKVNYSHLSNGDYEFVVAIKNGNKFNTIETFKFTVKKPWFISDVMIIMYLFLFGLTYYIYHLFLKKRNKEKLVRLVKEVEYQKELVKVKTEANKKEKEYWQDKQKLEQDIKNKSSELASKALSIASQNELLIELENLSKSIGKDSTISNLKTDINKILRNYTYTQNEWKVFETNLYELHQDFVSRLIKVYPDLTPKDIKLAIYLRMNMSSKEIAPLMKISFRGVELHRYRLRKKMELDSKINLSKFFINY